jgi:hypothetical protein
LPAARRRIDYPVRLRGGLARKLALTLLASCALACPCAAVAAGVKALYNPHDPLGAPFPSDRFTVRDPEQRTGKHVNLPLPVDCVAFRSECHDIANLNELDGFNVLPRLSIPFSGPIDPGTVNSNGVFIVEFAGLPANLRFFQGHIDPRITRVVGINQVVWDPETNTLHAHSDQMLKQHTIHVLIVTDAIRDPWGDRIEPPQGMERLMRGLQAPYAALLRHASRAVDEAGITPGRVVAASVFTTISVTPILEKIRKRLRTEPPPQAEFLVGPNGVRAVFSGPTLVSERQQVSTAPDFRSAFNFPVLGRVAFGKFRVPSFVGPEGFIPNVPTGSGIPQIYGENEIYFNLHLPEGPAPLGGWPVIVFAQGGMRSRFDSVLLHRDFVASGFAMINIHAPGHGGGPLGEAVVLSGGVEYRFPSGGRGIDLNGDGIIEDEEGSRPAAPTRRGFGTRDLYRHAVADLLQLVRMIQAGVDVDGDGVRDLNPDRVYFWGQSRGAAQGGLLLAVEPKLRIGALSTPAVHLNLWLVNAQREEAIEVLGRRTPVLLNINGGTDFDANMPFRDRPPLVNGVPGAMKLQEHFDRQEWLSQPGNSAAYAQHLIPARTLVQMVEGDAWSPNPSTSAFVRAGKLESRTSYLRWDLPDRRNRHGYSYSRPESRQQIITFFATDGATTIDPDGAGTEWETPIVLPLPEEPNW